MAAPGPSHSAGGDQRPAEQEEQGEIIGEEEEVPGQFDIKQMCRITSSPRTAMDFLLEKGILHGHPRCRQKNCRLDMVLEPTSLETTTDGLRWICKKCRRVRSIRDGSYFSKSKLRLEKLILLAYCWSFNIPAHAQAVFCGVTEATASRWNQYFRDICSTFLVRNPVKLGGVGKIVQIDESVMARRKYNVGHIPAGASRWVFGIVDVETRGLYMEFVENRSAEVLLPIIEKVVLPGTEIWSDCWGAYSKLNTMGYVHKTVNHSQNFVDPITKTCTNLIEVQWKCCKQKFKAMAGTQIDMIPSYLDEHMWRVQHGKKSDEAFQNILEQIGSMWPF